MRINIKKYNSKTYGNKEHWGKGPSKQKKKAPLFTRETFHTIKQKLIKQRQESLFNDPEFAGYVKISEKELYNSFYANDPGNSDMCVLWKMHAELGTVFFTKKEKREDIFMLLSAEFNMKIKIHTPSVTFEIPIYLLSVIEPTDEEVAVELMRWELGNNGK